MLYKALNVTFSKVHPNPKYHTSKGDVVCQMSNISQASLSLSENVVKTRHSPHKCIYNEIQRLSVLPTIYKQCLLMHPFLYITQRRTPFLATQQPF